jgi:two-component system, cell cycle response regulator
MKNVLLVGFIGMQIELARKFVKYRNLQDEVQLLSDAAEPTSVDTRVDAYVVNTDHHEAQQRLRTYVQARPALILGTGSQEFAGMHLFVPGTFKPATADRLVELLKLNPPLSAVKASPVVAAVAVVQPAKPAADVASKVVNFPVIAGTMTATVLVVDDSDLVRKTMVRKLNDYGERVDVATDGNDALEMLMTTKYKLVFLDIMMPGMDGFEVCKRIKKSPDHKSTAVYMLSSKDGMFDKVRGTMAGCNGYLVKPLESKQLRAVIQKHFPQQGGPNSEFPDSNLPGDSRPFQDSNLPLESQPPAPWSTPRPVQRPASSLGPRSAPPTPLQARPAAVAPLVKAPPVYAPKPAKAAARLPADQALGIKNLDDFPKTVPASMEDIQRLKH